MADLSSPYSVRQIKALPREGSDTFTGVMLVKRVSGKVAKNGNPFLNVELGDKTGSFSLNVFSDSPAYDIINAMKEGGIVRLEAKIDYYQDRLSPKLQRAEAITLDQLAGSPLLANLVETAPEDADALWAEFNQHIAAIGHAPKDILMFHECGLAIAMGQASAAVQRQVRFITRSNDADGFAYAVATWVLETSIDVTPDGVTSRAGDQRR